jgi:hypothetical protein
MRELKTTEVEMVAGAAASSNSYDVSLNMNVPSAQIPAVAGLLEQLLLGNLSASALAVTLLSDQTDFNAIEIDSITIALH